MIWGQMVTTPPSIPCRFPTRARWAILRQTDMAFTTWLGMCMSGVGIGMGRRLVNQQLLIQQERQQGATVFCAAAIGSPTPASLRAPFAAAASRASATATWGFVV